MTLKDSRSALIQHLLTELGTPGPLPSIMYDNVAFEAPNEIWLRVSFQPVENRVATLSGHGQDEASGFLQVSVQVPMEYGSGEAYEMVDKIIAAFDAGAILPYDNGTTQGYVFSDGANASPAITFESFYSIPVTVDWRSRRTRNQ
ncbi:phage tail terminator-like protein [uncultured Salinibacterium sp.]|uniref:phage tail terminator-like protein n=1 Tax=uncultured Salinibacterium sp. TaxID=459274 RepID=UPI0030DC0605|tara:strand:- start:1385 stop:1819 length:435 start_codon:yes stop_codon:yes gene_type:complete